MKEEKKERKISFPSASFIFKREKKEGDGRNENLVRSIKSRKPLTARDRVSRSFISIVDAGPRARVCFTGNWPRKRLILCCDTKARS